MSRRHLKMWLRHPVTVDWFREAFAAVVFLSSLYVWLLLISLI